MLISCPKCGLYVCYDFKELCDHLRKINSEEVKGDERPKQGG